MEDESKNETLVSGDNYFDSRIQMNGQDFHEFMGSAFDLNERQCQAIMKKLKESNYEAGQKLQEMVMDE
jgi:hypothetical protein